MPRIAKLTPTHDAKRDRWVLNIPPSLSTDGKRRREYFTSRTVARKRARTLTDQVIDYGIATAKLTPTQHADALEALNVMGDAGTLLQAASLWVKTKEAQKTAISFHDLAVQYSEAREITPKYARRIISVSNRCSPFFGDKFTFEITHHDITDALVALKVQGNWWNETRALIRTMFKWGKLRGYHQHDPTESVEKKTHVKVRPEIMPVHDCEKLIRTAESRFLPYVILTLLCGMRGMEARRIQWDDIDLESKTPTIYLGAGLSKTGVDRYIDLEPSAVAWLNQLEARNGLVVKIGDWGISQGIKKANKDHGIKWQPSILRHTACSMHFALFQDANRSTAWAGHTLSVNLRHYRRAVTKEDAIKFWSITPDGRTAAAIVA